MSRIDASDRDARPAAKARLGETAAPDALRPRMPRDTADVLRKVYLEITTQCDLDLQDVHPARSG